MALLLLGLVLLLLIARVDITHTLTLSWSRNGESIAQTVPVDASGETNRNVTVPPATTDMRVDINIDADKVQSLYVLSDQAVTIETNSATVPGNTLTIAANKPYIWYSGCGLTNPITVDVTASIYLTNPGSTAANVRIRILEDVTS